MDTLEYVRVRAHTLEHRWTSQSLVRLVGRSGWLEATERWNKPIVSVSTYNCRYFSILCATCPSLIFSITAQLVNKFWFHDAHHFYGTRELVHCVRPWLNYKDMRKYWKTWRIQVPLHSTRFQFTAPKTLGRVPHRQCWSLNNRLCNLLRRWN